MVGRLILEEDHSFRMLMFVYERDYQFPQTPNVIVLVVVAFETHDPHPEFLRHYPENIYFESWPLCDQRTVLQLPRLTSLPNSELLSVSAFLKRRLIWLDQVLQELRLLDVPSRLYFSDSGLVRCQSDHVSFNAREVASFCYESWEGSFACLDSKFFFHPLRCLSHSFVGSVWNFSSYCACKFHRNLWFRPSRRWNEVSWVFLYNERITASYTYGDEVFDCYLTVVQFLMPFIMLLNSD